MEAEAAQATIRDAPSRDTVRESDVLVSASRVGRYAQALRSAEHQGHPVTMRPGHLFAPARRSAVRTGPQCEVMELNQPPRASAKREAVAALGGNYCMTTSTSNASDPIARAAEIVAAFVAHNSLPLADLPALIHSVHAAVVKITSAALAPNVAEPAAPTPAVSIRQSITPDYLICLDDGGKFKSLRRHLGGLGMTPDEYRAKWKLPTGYPMVAANYAAQRSMLAKKIGLGHYRKAVAVPKSESADKTKPGRGRPRKATT
jgi:predicted transcriptional regulator